MELANKQSCIILRNGIELWIDDNDLKDFKKDLEMGNLPKIIKINDQFFNIADFVGLFSADKVEEYRRQKRGEWRCHRNQWHKRQEECEHKSIEYEKQQRKRERTMREMGINTYTTL